MEEKNKLHSNLLTTRERLSTGDLSQIYFYFFGIDDDRNRQRTTSRGCTYKRISFSSRVKVWLTASELPTKLRHNSQKPNKSLRRILSFSLQDEDNFKDFPANQQIQSLSDLLNSFFSTFKSNGIRSKMSQKADFLRNPLDSLRQQNQISTFQFKWRSIR